MARVVYPEDRYQLHGPSTLLGHRFTVALGAPSALTDLERQKPVGVESGRVGPNIIAGQVYMVPAQRRELSEQRFLAGATDAECVNGTFEVSTVEQDDRGSDEVERGGARLLVFDAAIPEAPEPVKRDRSGVLVTAMEKVPLSNPLKSFK